MHFAELASVHYQTPTLLTIGKFDGVHQAHQQLLRRLVERARQHNCHSAVLTFDPHPDEILRPEREIRYLTTINERAALMQELGIDLLAVLPFTHATSQLSPKAFLQLLLNHVPVRELWVGPDFKLGHRGTGTIPVLQEFGQELGFTVEPIPYWTLDGEIVSSTAIRTSLAAGDVQTANHYLGRAFSLQGTVIPGDQRGRKIGFPTANVQIASNHTLPADGVYVCKVQLLDDRRSFGAVTNIGVRPTFGVLGRAVEAHLFDFNEDIYGRPLRVSFLQHIRGEQKFAGIEQLVAQIGRDAQFAREWLANA
ncbi:MAG TPA: bifunctional riboflavin kinase/FMN adenylyltransferase [Herpetosiphon sp.]|nr:bifunctional riboflavin kinase/FAD synthetase [Herpetosiphon sp.]HBW53036.1 bifunctional riboflavin kinase/FMN adenylyltransferase [Herpetosiphon sp.]